MMASLLCWDLEVEFFLWFGRAFLVLAPFRSAEVKATAAPAPAKPPAQTAPAPLPAAAKAAPEKPVEKPPVRKKVAGVAAGDDGDIW